MVSSAILANFFEEQWKTTHNTFWDCRVHFFPTTFLEIAVYLLERPSLSKNGTVPGIGSFKSKAPEYRNPYLQHHGTSLPYTAFYIVNADVTGGDGA